MEHAGSAGGRVNKADNEAQEKGLWTNQRTAQCV